MAGIDPMPPEPCRNIGNSSRGRRPVFVALHDFNHRDFPGSVQERQ
jgi:hypothetical protein